MLDKFQKPLSEDGPIAKELKKPPIKYIKHKDYGVRKLYERLGKKSPVYKP